MMRPNCAFSSAAFNGAMDAHAVLDRREVGMGRILEGVAVHLGISCE